MKYLPIILVLVLLLAYVILTYNAFIVAKNRVTNQRSQIDVELKKRFDLIPNLVEVVKAYAKHEKTTLEDVVKARSNYDAATDLNRQMDAGQQLNGALSRLFAITESYPELKADVNFRNLQNDLRNTEKSIAYSRQFYNDAVNIYNNKISMFPAKLIAALFAMKEESFFVITEAERESIKVDIRN